MFLISLILSAATAQAMPAIGDTATYKGMHNGNDVVFSQTITAFDQATNSFTVDMVWTELGQTEKKSEQRASDHFITDAQAQSLVANCTQFGGEAVQMTVPAGTFSVCKMTETRGSETQVVAVSDVSFGLVKFVQMGGKETIDVELVSQSKGK